jgi:hypothetical protein
MMKAQSDDSISFKIATISLSEGPEGAVEAAGAFNKGVAGTPPPGVAEPASEAYFGGASKPKRQSTFRTCRRKQLSGGWRGVGFTDSSGNGGAKTASRSFQSFSMAALTSFSLAVKFQQIETPRTV